MNIVTNRKIILPSLPNFIMFEDEPGNRQDGFKERDKISISELTDDQIVELGKLWTEELLNHAKRIRSIKMCERCFLSDEE